MAAKHRVQPLKRKIQNRAVVEVTAAAVVTATRVAVVVVTLKMSQAPRKRRTDPTTNTPHRRSSVSGRAPRRLIPAYCSDFVLDYNVLH